MDIGFILAYVVCPIVLAAGAAWGKRRNNKKAVAEMLVAKGVFYFSCAAAYFINYIKDDSAIRYAIGLTIGIAIMEGTMAILDGCEQTKKHYEDKYNVKI